MLENLDWLIIEKLRQEERERNERPRLHLPIPEYEEIDEAENKEEVKEPKRVIIIEL